LEGIFLALGKLLAPIPQPPFLLPPTGPERLCRSVIRYWHRNWQSALPLQRTHNFAAGGPSAYSPRWV